ncbi:hypothetical protein HPP92_009779 [Vanilla planifolia]|uniref:PMI1/PMIR1-2 C-terminal domain-containing protein n=1 Tax=Vanilla planifolia TaxID=51239 RepID=A0A835RAX0_VANPL|nr:hypothetical protein HPP92_009779 [Vanilla planifolia]
MEGMEKNLEGSRIRQWDAVFGLFGKASGGQLVLKLGFQIMEDGGIGIYNQPNEAPGGVSSKGMARKHSKSSFSISSPKAARPAPSSTPSKENSVLQLQRIEEFNLDDGPALPPPSKHETEAKAYELDIPEYEVEDKGVEGPLEREEAVEVDSNKATDEASVSSEVVNKVVLDSAHLVRLTELDSIAQQIKALESMMTEEDEGQGGEDASNLYIAPLKENTQQLDADEESVTREFLQLLELEGDREDVKYKTFSNSLKSPDAESHNYETKSYLSDLGKGLGPVVQTRDGGYLASMNPLETEIARRELPKLAMQISRPIVLTDKKSTTGCELFQKLAAKGLEELGAKLLTLTAMDELVGKTPEQIAFEGIASAIVSGRKKEMATSAAAKSIEILKSMAAAMNEGRKERILTGIWNLKEEPLASLEEVLCFSLQKLESMAVEALKVQAGVAEEEAPFDVSPISEGEREWLLNSAEPLDKWTEKGNGKVEGTILLVIFQLRDPLRRFEAVGAPLIAMVKASKAGDGGMGKEEGFKLASLHVGGMKLRQGKKRSYWDGEKQRLTAMQWLVGYGLAKAGRKMKLGEVGGVGKDSIWSLSSRVMADMWLKSTRNPDVRLLEQ